MGEKSIDIKWLIEKGYTCDLSGAWSKNSQVLTKVAKMSEIEQKVAKTGIYTFEVTPMGKPSFQKSDKWRIKDHSDPKRRQRSAVGRWIETKEKMFKAAQKQGFVMPESGADIKFLLPMPAGWSRKKKEMMKNTPHKHKPDLDNLMKFLGDSICEEDSYIFNYTLSKFWHTTGKIIIIVK